MTSDDPLNVAGEAAKNPEPGDDVEPADNPDGITVGEAVVGAAALGLAGYVAYKQAQKEAKHAEENAKAMGCGCLMVVVLILGAIGNACEGPEDSTTSSTTSTYGTR
ncbi:hypothetical protein [Streptomyces virginiae]|uniref:hypothetical protein n=1 Tax=Streptomyces virginiae TaxID=1961 RepID=UPI002F90BCD8|nr:hypothetical protein OG253_41965 [Streptomyces virginiae]